MARILGLRIRNFGTLRDVTMGRLWNDKGISELTPMTAVIGKNGAGKSTLFDAFGFIADCLKTGVEEACDAKRGGFKRIVSQGINEPIMFEVHYREDANTRPITYEVAFALDEQARPYVKSERLSQRREGQSKGRPFSFMILENGRGVVWKNHYEGVKEDTPLNFGEIESLMQTESSETETVELLDNRRLGIATLGAMKQHPRISSFTQFLEGWFISYFTPDAARGLPLAGPQRHLSVHGGNIGNVVQFIQRDHPKQFQRILEQIAQKIPGVEKISTELTLDNRLVLQFNDKGFSEPFLARQMSDGTLKVFMYLLLLSDPNPPPFICIEEPENGLYHKLLETLAQEFREHATNGKHKSQVFITTHQPYFVNALEPNEVWILDKGDDGFSTIRRTSDDPLIKALVEEGLPLGGLWYSDYLEKGEMSAF